MALTYTTDWAYAVHGASAAITSGTLSASVGDYITVAVITEDNDTMTAYSIANNNTAITWGTAKITTNTTNNCKVVMWAAFVPSGTPLTTITVTCTAGTHTTNAKSLATSVHTGAHATTPLPAGNLFSGTGATDVSQSMTPSSNGSCLWMVGGDWNATNTFAARTNCTLVGTRHEAGWYTSTFIRPTTQPRTDTSAFALGETDTSGLIAWAAWEVQAAATGTTISCTVGDAVANGSTASLNRTLSASVGNAVANGSTAALNRTIVSSVGNAVADGATASLNRTISATVGNAVADGSTATISAANTISCTVGNAVANGSTAAINSSIGCTTGNATADGATAALNRTIECSTGNATAAGVDADIQTGSSTTISCTVGNAVADGSTAALNVEIECSTGNAIADGLTATITTLQTISCTIGNAAADGQTAALNRTIECTTGNATADGSTADIGLGVVINCTVGNAEANGSIATILNLGEAEEILGGGGFAFWADRTHKKPTKKEKKKIAEILEEAEELVSNSKFNKLTNKKIDKYTSMLASIEEILTTRQKQRVQYIQQQQQKRKYRIYASAALLT